jgi:hypothetical protein
LSPPWRLFAGADDDDDDDGARSQRDAPAQGAAQIKTPGS